jgi:hypothetical protein
MPSSVQTWASISNNYSRKATRPCSSQRAHARSYSNLFGAFATLHLSGVRRLVHILCQRRFLLQLEELLLDEPENQDYQGLYHDVQEVRFCHGVGRDLSCSQHLNGTSPPSCDVRAHFAIQPLVRMLLGHGFLQLVQHCPCVLKRPYHVHSKAVRMCHQKDVRLKSTERNNPAQNIRMSRKHVV